MKILFTFLILSIGWPTKRIPIDANDINLTEIGQFGINRKARPHVPTHLHTGIDIKRPYPDYDHAVIYPIADGIVISKREDGPYAQLIIEHEDDGNIYWSLYEHIAGILVNLGDEVDTDMEIARFFNRDELDLHGWQFDHFHLEVLKESPIEIAPAQALPDRFYKAYTLTCFTFEELMNKYYDPLDFLAQ
mgnify:CR=1 FL=1